MELGFVLHLSCAVLILVLLFSAWRALLYAWWRPKRLESQLRRQGVRGNRYSVLYGDLKEQGMAYAEAWSKPMDLNHRIMARVSPFVHSTVQKYGKTSLIWQGPTPRVLICDPALIKEVLSDRSGCIQKVPVTPQTKPILTGVATLEGDEWATRRKLINHAFYLEKLKAMLPAFLTSCDNLVDRWDKILTVGDDARTELDVWPELQSLTKDAISRTAFGSSYEEGRMIFELQREQVELVLEDVMKSPYIPGFRYLPTAKNKRRRYLGREINKMLLHIIEQKEQAMKRGESCSDDLLGLLLQSKWNNDGSSDKETTAAKKQKITTQDIIDECKLFYFAGQETTSAWLTWTIILLAVHQDWQQKAREEVLQLCGRQQPDYEILGNLTIVTMVLNEVFRLYSPVTSLFRHTPTGVNLGGITYPSGVEFFLQTMMVHHDPTYWGEDAEEFNPERFSPGLLKAASKDSVAFFPFGAGPRICLGQNFAMLEAKIALVRLLQHFSFELSPSYTHAPMTVITLQPQFGAQIFVQRL